MACQHPPDAACHPQPERLDLLVVDPETVFAYWHLTEARLRAHLAYLGLESGRMLLRLYRRREEQWVPWRDEGPLPLSGSLYLTRLTPGSAYQAELGVLASGSAFIALLTSLPVTCPPSGTADLVPDLPAPPVLQPGGLAVRGFAFDLRS